MPLGAPRIEPLEPAFARDACRGLSKLPYGRQSRMMNSARTR